MPDKKLKVKGGMNTSADFLRMVREGQGAPPSSGNKFAAVRTTTELGTFDSIHESNWATQLFLMQQRGYIRDLRLQKCDLRFALDMNGTRIADYEADARFTCVKDCEIGPHKLKAGEKYVCDAKSPPTRKTTGYIMKKKMMHALHKIDILEL